MEYGSDFPGTSANPRRKGKGALVFYTSAPENLMTPSIPITSAGSAGLPAGSSGDWLRCVRMRQGRRGPARTDGDIVSIRPARLTWAEGRHAYY